MPRKRNDLRSATKIKMEQIVRLQVLDKTNDEIGAVMGMTAGSVAELINHREYASLRDRYIERMYGPVDAMIEQRKASVIMEDAAPDAAEVLGELIYSPDEVTQRLAATAILDRSGHGPIARKAVKVRHELDPVSAALLREAMQEADAIKVVDVEVVEDA